MRKKTGSIRPHGDGWQIRYTDVNGGRHAETHPTREEAERQLAIRLGDLAKGHEVTAKPHTVLFEELCADVVLHYEANRLHTHDDINRRFVLHILPYLGHRRAASITTATLNAYIVKRRGERFKNKPVQDGTIARELEAIKRAFHYGRDTGKVVKIPKIPRIREDNVRSGFFTREEVDRLCSHLKAPLNHFVLFAFLTGWRYSEIRDLEWRNVDFARREIRIDAGKDKNQKGRVFPMTEELRGLLETAAKTKVALKGRAAKADSPGVNPVRMPAGRTQHVFTIANRPVGQFRKSWATACQKAGLPVRLETETYVAKRGKWKGQERIRVKRIVALRLFHDLRRSGVRELARVLGERRAMVRTGHLTRSVFDRYNIVSDFDLSEDRKLLDAAKRDGKRDTDAIG